MSVGTPSEWGHRGYEVTVARYGTHQMNLWRRRGGRKKNPTLADLMKAVTGPTTRTKKAGGSNPPATTQDL